MKWEVCLNSMGLNAECVGLKTFPTLGEFGCWGNKMPRMPGFLPVGLKIDIKAITG